jgi:hypothetical protein
MERNAAHVTDFFNLPGEQVVEIREAQLQPPCPPSPPPNAVPDSACEPRRRLPARRDVGAPNVLTVIGFSPSVIE